MKIRLPYALHEMGQRANQEDSIYPLRGEANDMTRMFLVCDGMGGHENGEVASGLVCKTFAECLSREDAESFTTEAFLEALSASYDALDREDPTPESQRKMGTTLTFLHLNSREAVVAHLGDSRIYHVRPSAAEPILYKSCDHSLVNELVRAEVITPEEALTHPRRNVITRAMQPNLEQRHKADIRTITDVAEGDYFFLCSDGVLESVTDALLVDVLRRNISDEEKIEALKSACEASSRDNFSAYLVPIAEGIMATPEPKQFAEVMDTQYADDEHVAPAPKRVKRVGVTPSSRSGLLLGLALLAGLALGVILLWPRIGENTDVKDDDSRVVTKPAIELPKDMGTLNREATVEVVSEVTDATAEAVEEVEDDAEIEELAEEESSVLPEEAVVEPEESVGEESTEVVKEDESEEATESPTENAVQEGTVG
ncbi:MAG: serine/threonine-protein phosphatase [Alistipes sp.]|nr:serine/threonine-protein phosphatase [Alistipes sp.]